MIREMTINDVDRIVELENELYSAPWNKLAVSSEITSNEFAHMFVLEIDNQIAGYYGYWLVNDYATVTKVSIAKAFQGQHLANELMKDLIERCERANATVIDLEVRVSNYKAISLYEKYGFEQIGIRKGYYTDNNEDALLMYKSLRKGDHYERFHIGN